MRFITARITGNSRVEGELNGNAVLMPIEALAHISFSSESEGWISDLTGHAVRADSITFCNSPLEAFKEITRILNKGETNDDTNH